MRLTDQMLPFTTRLISLHAEQIQALPEVERWELYEAYKTQLRAQDLAPDDYERRIDHICDLLNL